MSCSCDNIVLGNTGTTNCDPIAQVAKKLIFVETYDSTGALNKYDPSAPLTQIVFDALVNQVDTSKRWYPSVLMEGVTGERADNVIETAGSGRIFFVKEGAREFAGEFWAKSATYLNKLKSSRCADFSVYIIDAEGNLIGMDKGDGFLYPISVEKESVQVKLILATDTTVQKIPFKFQWESSEKDENLSMISSSNITADLLGSKGLIDVNMKVVSCGQTSLVVKMTTDYGSVGNKIVDSGLIITNFFNSVGGTNSKLKNVTTNTDVTITTVTESPKGTYTFAYTSQTVGNVLRVTPVKTGRDYSSVPKVTCTVA
jgi:hypothetical protein